MKRKRICILVMALVFLGLLAIFRHELFQFGVEAYLNQTLSQKGWKFDYKNVQVRRDGISFSGVSLKTGEPLAECQVEVIDILVKHKKGFQFDVGVSVRAPFISLRRESQGELALADVLKFSHLKMEVDGGEVEFVGGKEKEHFYFSVASDEKRRRLGVVSLSRAKGDLPQVKMKLYEWPEELIVELELHEADLPWLNQMRGLVYEDEWDIVEGVASGHVWFGFLNDGTISQINGNLRVLNASGKHEENGLQGKVEAISVDLSYPNFALAVDVKGGRIGCRDVNTGLDFALCDLNGRLNFHSFRDSEILLKGVA